jgi:hypothetical protein
MRPEKVLRPIRSRILGDTIDRHENWPSTTDLVVLKRDPANEIAALADVRYAIRDGVVIYARE